MKGKKINQKIKSSRKLIKEYNKKGNSGLKAQSNNILRELIKKHDHAVELKDEISLLKTTLKSKKKELASGAKDLSKSRKDARKALKKAKNQKLPESVTTKKSAPRQVVRIRKRKPSPAPKPAKPKVAVTNLSV